MKRAAIRTLACDAINATPINHADWTVGLGDTWEPTEASRCETCNEAIVGFGGERHDMADDTGECECKGHIGEQEGPMMSYWYPLAIDDTAEAARTIVDLPLCVVTVGGETGLALTGGGMDLTWEICEAFMLLGRLPPMHFASRLPQICGRGTSERDRWIAAGCIRSCTIAAQWARNGAANVRRTLQWGRDYETKREACKAAH